MALASELGLISGRRVGYKANGRCSNSHLRGNSACARKDVESQGCGPGCDWHSGSSREEGGRRCRTLEPHYRRQEDDPSFLHLNELKNSI